MSLPAHLPTITVGRDEETGRRTFSLTFSSNFQALSLAGLCSYADEVDLDFDPSAGPITGPQDARRAFEDTVSYVRDAILAAGVAANSGATDKQIEEMLQDADAVVEMAFVGELMVAVAEAEAAEAPVEEGTSGE